MAEGGEEEAEMEVEEEEEEEKPAQPVGGGVTPRGGVRDGKKGVWAEAGDEDEEDDDKEKKQGVRSRKIGVDRACSPLVVPLKVQH